MLLRLLNVYILCVTFFAITKKREWSADKGAQIILNTDIKKPDSLESGFFIFLIFYNPKILANKSGTIPIETKAKIITTETIL